MPPLSSACWAVVVVLAVSSLLLVAHAQDTHCMEHLFDDVSDCFTRSGLDLSARPGQQDATTLMRETQTMDPAIQCQNLDAYKKAINCSLTIIRGCLVVIGMGGTIPDIQRFQKGLETLCQRQDEFDGECLKQHYPDILSCGEETVKGVVQKGEKLTMKTIICISTDVNYDCSKKHLKSCKNDTLDIYLEQLNKYQVPSACVDSPPGRAGRQSYVSESDGGDTGTAATVLGSGLATVVSLGLYHLLLLH